MSFRTVCALVAAAALVVALTAVATAAKISDPKGDVADGNQLPSGVKKADVDLVKASDGRANGKIVMKAEVAGSMKRALKDHTTSPTFAIKAPGNDRYGVYPLPDGSYEVLNFTSSGTKPASVKRTDAHTAEVRFRPSAIGNPSHFKFFATTGDCVVFDVAPNTGFAKRGKRC